MNILKVHVLLIKSVGGKNLDNWYVPLFAGICISGSFATASCLICKYKVDCEVVRGDIFNQVIIILELTGEKELYIRNIIKYIENITKHAKSFC